MALKKGDQALPTNILSMSVHNRLPALICRAVQEIDTLLPMGTEWSLAAEHIQTGFCNHLLNIHARLIPEQAMQYYSLFLTNILVSFHSTVIAATPSPDLFPNRDGSQFRAEQRRLRKIAKAKLSRDN